MMYSKSLFGSVDRVWLFHDSIGCIPTSARAAMLTISSTGDLG